MEGFFYNTYAPRGDVSAISQASEDIRLLARHGELEIMSLYIAARSTVWLVPGGDIFEFFFVHQGELELLLDGERVRFPAGSSFYLHGLREDVLVKAESDALLLHVSSAPVFQETLNFERDYERLLEQIQEKDHYTHTHSISVMHYSVKLFEAMQAEGFHSDVCMHDMIVASLFHDVGKCFVPDDILKKPGPLSREEMEVMRRHPLDSAALLEPGYGRHVAEIVRDHHERLDGSGYPSHLTAEHISTEARILAVADCFDAMTSVRSYNRIRSQADAAAELKGLPNQLDARITELLCKLVSSGQI